MMARCVVFKRSWKRLASMPRCVRRGWRKAIRFRSAISNWNGRNNMTASRQRALITILIVIGSVIVGFFGWRTLHAFREFRGHRPPPPFAPDAAQVETDVELIRDWMTISYISRTYEVPPKILFDALGIPSRG